MKLILLESVDGLGRPGDEVSVKAGFARNFLIPQRKAVMHSADSLRMLGRLKRKADEEERAMLSSAEELAGKLEGFSIEVAARATEEGHLFGSVTEKDIHAALVAAGWDVALRAVRLPAHLKEAGENEVVLHLYGEIRSTIKVVVQPVDIDGTVIEPSEAEHRESEDGDGGDAAPKPAADDDDEGATTGGHQAATAQA